MIIITAVAANCSSKNESTKMTLFLVKVFCMRIKFMTRDDVRYQTEWWLALALIT
jgi:hypothetical protein